MQARLILHAINPDQAIKRFFNITIAVNLFGETILTINRGRLGKGGHLKAQHYQDLNILAQDIIKILKRRFSAIGRLGTNYQVVEQGFDDEFEKIVWSKLKNKDACSSTDNNCTDNNC